ncbi:MAG: glycosyltransferase family 4 protein [bacterium]
MPNIAYFSNQFADRLGHGLSRYSRELYQALVSLETDIQIKPTAAWSDLEEEALTTLKRSTGLELLPTGRRMTAASWAFVGWPRLESLVNYQVDVVHAVALGYPIATRKPLVVTIHDIGPLTHPEYFTNTRPWVMRKSLNQVVHQADAVICVSNSTAHEVQDYLQQDMSDRIQVIPEGVNDFFFHQSDGKEPGGVALDDRAPPFLLAAGKISPRKNIHGLLKAFSFCADKIPHDLVLVGGDGWRMEETEELLDNSRLAGRVRRLGYISDETLRYLYGHASAYLYPSFYEGFGLTVLEAMAAGCPVVTSDRYSLPEVAGDAAILVDPESVEDMAEAIMNVCTNESVAAAMSDAGRSRARQFSWQACAEQTVELYRLVS